MSTGGRFRLRVLAAGLCIAVTALSSAGIRVTEATWTDAEASRADLTALVLLPPTITGRTCPGLLFGDLTVTWSWAHSGAPFPLPPSNAAWRINDNPATPTTTGPVNGVYTSTFGRGLVDGLSSYTVDAATALQNWTSAQRSQVTCP